MALSVLKPFKDAYGRVKQAVSKLPSMAKQTAQNAGFNQYLGQSLKETAMAPVQAVQKQVAPVRQAAVNRVVTPVRSTVQQAGIATQTAARNMVNSAADKTYANVGKPMNSYFAPTPNVRTRDVVREVGATAKNWFIETPARTAVGLMNSMPGPMRQDVYTPGKDPSLIHSTAEKFFLGTDPIKSAQVNDVNKWGREKGLSPAQATMLAGAAMFGGTIADVTTGGGGKKQAAQAIAKSTDAAQIFKILKTFNTAGGDTALKQAATKLSKVTDPKIVLKTLDAMGEVSKTASKGAKATKSLIKQLPDIAMEDRQIMTKYIDAQRLKGDIPGKLFTPVGPNMERDALRIAEHYGLKPKPGMGLADTFDDYLSTVRGITGSDAGVVKGMPRLKVKGSSVYDATGKEIAKLSSNDHALAFKRVLAHEGAKPDLTEFVVRGSTVVDNKGKTIAQLDSPDLAKAFRRSLMQESDRFKRMIHGDEYAARADESIEQLMAQRAKVKANELPLTRETVNSVLNGRPAHQQMLEEAINKGDYLRAKKVIDLMDDSDPFKDTMIKTFGPDIKEALRHHPATLNQAQPAFGGVAGFEAEYDENGKIVGTKFDPTKAAMGIGAMYTYGKVKPGQAQKAVSSTADYLAELKKTRMLAEKGAKPGLGQQIFDLVRDFKRKQIDSVSPIEDALHTAAKKGKYEILPSKDFSLQVDRVLRADNLAGQFLKDHGLVDVVKKVDDLDALDEYLIAKQAVRVKEFGIETGRNLKHDAQLIKDLAPQYEETAQQVTKYSQTLLDYVTDSGLISPKLAAHLKKKYPDYVPLNRIMDEIDNTVQGTSKAVASLSKQTVVQKLKGSDRVIQSPVKSLFEKTVDAVTQGEKNRAAQMLASYIDLPGNPLGLRKLGSGELAGGKNTISVLRNGVKEVYETADPMIADAAKNLGRQHLGFLGQLFAVPVRAVKLTATGLNLPFVASNLSKDQMGAFIMSNRAASTSLLNPGNFMRAFWSALKHDDLYDEVVRNAAGGTSFDLMRNNVAPAIDKIRASRTAGGNIAYHVTHPGELLRAMEDIVGRSEELTRIQQFRGTKQALLKEGRTASDASLLAAKAARDNTVNFARFGDWGRVTNLIIPYLNAGVQGARLTVRNFAQRPVQTTAKTVVGVMTPLAGITYWNLSDPKRRQVYNDIQEFEKENNFIIVPDNPTKDEKGRWNVIKIPLAQGLTGIASVQRRMIEASQGMDEVKFNEVAGQVIKTLTSIDVSDKWKVASTVTPQAFKPYLESTTNTNFFTGRPIVGRDLEGLPPEEQYYVGTKDKPGTSGTAIKVGQAMGVSPRHVENFIRTSFSGVGQQVLNTSDRILAGTGQISPNQIGGQDTADAISARFNKARGGAEADRIYKAGDEMDAEKKRRNRDIKARLQAGDPRALDGLTKKEAQALIRSVREKGERDALDGPKRAMYDVPIKDRVKIIQKATGAPPKLIKAAQVIQEVPADQQEAYIRYLKQKGVLTKQNKNQFYRLLEY